MKELSIEEKAKAYDEAIKKAKKDLQVCEQDCLVTKQIFRYFPELAEPEDEKIRKALITYFQRFPYVGIESAGTNAKEALAWLEKQGKSDKIVEKAKIEKQRVLITESDGNAYIDWDTRSLEDARKLLEYGLQYINTELEKQGEQEVNEPDWCHHKVDLSDCSEEYRKAYYDGWNNCNQQHSQCNAEQKSADKVELKFKVGNWVVSPNGVYWHIDAIQNGRYEVTADTGQCGNWPLYTNIYRLWTIADAKPGDVLAYDDDSLTIFHYRLSDLDTELYVSYILLTDKIEFKQTCVISNVHPATKEQRDLLFQKMKESGYEWDAEKKELKKIDARKNLTLDGDLMEADCMIVGQELAWSEEDDYNLQCMIAKVVSDIQKGNVGRNNELIDWLKFLKQRYTWKPSDGQMKALDSVIDEYDGYPEFDSLVSLKNDLRKL